MNPNNALWLVVANVAEETKNFVKGAKIYCLPWIWGDAGERIRVIGQHRKSKRHIEIIMGREKLTNFRAKEVFDPSILKKIGHIPVAKMDRAEAVGIARFYNEVVPKKTI